jgi:hypothetical protein
MACLKVSDRPCLLSMSQPSAEKKGPRKGRTSSQQTGGAELLFFVVAGEEDLTVLVEAVDQTFDGVGRGRTHRREDSGSM